MHSRRVLFSSKAQLRITSTLIRCLWGASSLIIHLRCYSTRSISTKLDEIEYIPRSDVQILAEPKRMQLLYEYYTLVTYCELTVNAPYIRPPNMMIQGMYQTEPVYPDIDHIICPPILNDCLLFHDISHNAFVEPLVSIAIRLNRYWPTRP